MAFEQEVTTSTPVAVARLSSALFTERSCSWLVVISLVSWLLPPWWACPSICCALYYSPLPETLVRTSGSADAVVGHVTVEAAADLTWACP